MKYIDVVRNAQADIKSRTDYGYGKVQYEPCSIWENGDQINLWTYWQGYQLKDIDERGVDILLVGQDWGNPNLNMGVLDSIKAIQEGRKGTKYLIDNNPTDNRLIKMFKAFGGDVNIEDQSPGLRLFFTNYSLGYRAKGCSETGGMTKTLMAKDRELFNDLVSAIRPKMIICLGRLTYEMVSEKIANGFVERLGKGIPFESKFPGNPNIQVYGVAHCGARGCSNIHGEENMIKAWRYLADKYKTYR